MSTKAIKDDWVGITYAACFVFVFIAGGLGLL